MASFKRYTATLGDATWPSGFTSIYTVPTGKKSVITGITVCNTSEYELPVSIRAQAGDSQWDKVSLLAPFQDDYEDKSSTPLAAPTNTGTTLDYTKSKFGTASARFNGSANLSFADDASLGLDADFTIEFWFYTDALPTTDAAYPLSKTASSLGTAGTWSFSMSTSGLISFCDNSGGSLVSIGDPGTVTAETWHHIAVSRTGTTLRGFLDGVLGFTATNSTDWTNAQALLIGTSATGTSPNITGNIQDVRITKGLGRYTSAFSSPGKRFGIGEGNTSFLSEVHVPAGESIKVITAEKVVLEGDDTVQGTAPLVGGAFGGEGADTYDVWLSVYEDV